MADHDDADELLDDSDGEWVTRGLQAVIRGLQKVPRTVSRRFSLGTIVVVVVLVVAIALASVLVYKHVRDKDEKIDDLTAQVEAKPTATVRAELNKNLKVEMREAIVHDQEARTVLEVASQDVDIPYTVTHDGFAHWGVNRASQDFLYHATGVYRVDLSRLDADDVSYDESADVVTIRVPYPTLTVDIDETKTEIRDVEKGAFVHGDLMLTPEESQQIAAQVKGQARASLSTDENFDKAEEAARQQVAALYEPVVQGVSPTTTVKVVVSDPPLADEG